MANKATVAGDLRRFATFVKGLTDAADTLDQMQQIEEEAAANTASITAAQATLTGIQRQIADADRELVDLRGKATTSTRNAQTKAAQIEADAEVKAANIIEVARQSAQVQADSIVLPAQATVTALLDQAASLNEQLQRMQDDEKTMTTRAMTARAELDDLEAKLTAARESIAKLLGQG